MYNKIAKDYHNKRKQPWKTFEIYFQSLIKDGNDFSGTCIDLGCANGRHFKLLKRENNKLIGIDNSLEFLKIAHNNIKNSENLSSDFKNGIDLILADINLLPLRKNTISHIFSIATIHHIYSERLRKVFFSKIYSLLKNKGYFIFSVWRRWQKRFRKYFFLDFFRRILKRNQMSKKKRKDVPDFGDILISWTYNAEDVKVMRYYHLFSKKEILSLTEKFTLLDIIKTGGPSKKDNFFVAAQKISNN